MKRIKKLLAIMMVVGALLSCIKGVVLQDNTTASAMGNSSKVYYITDYACSNEIEQKIIDETADTTNPLTVEKIQLPSADDYKEYLLALLEYYEMTESEEYTPWCEIKNAYVIFEMRGILATQVIPEGDVAPRLTDLLCEMFYTWQRINFCTIMFICGTDETRFGAYTEFLEYVDIHVNTDIFHVFVSTIFEQISLDCGDRQWRNVTLILDESLSTGIIEGKYTKSRFFLEYFLAYIQTVYVDELQSKGTIRALFENYNIKIVCYATNDGARPTYFYDIVHQFYFDIEKEGMDIIKNDNIYAIGTSWSVSSVDPLQLLELVSDLRERYGIEDETFKIYYYNDAKYTSAVLEEDYVYQAHTVRDFSYVILPFVEDDIMTRFDNWPGVCDITHKPLDPSENGWLSEFAAILLDIDGWNIFMTQEEYDQYIGNVDEWLYG